MSALNWTKKTLHEGSKLHERTNLHDDNFPRRVDLHGRSFLHESKKNTIKKKINKIKIKNKENNKKKEKEAFD